LEKKKKEIKGISKLHEEWKISPFQALGQGSKNGNSVHPSSQNAKPISKLSQIPKYNFFLNEKIGGKGRRQGEAARGAARNQSDCGLWLPATPVRVPITPSCKNPPFSSCPHLWAHVVNSCWLAPTLTYHAQFFYYLSLTFDP
jgi:hypothetical protein